MAEERDREHTGPPPSEAVKGEKADEPRRPPSKDKKDEAPQATTETDLLIEDRFEATDN